MDLGSGVAVGQSRSRGFIDLCETSVDNSGVALDGVFGGLNGGFLLGLNRLFEDKGGSCFDSGSLDIGD